MASQKISLSETADANPHSRALRLVCKTWLMLESLRPNCARNHGIGLIAMSVLLNFVMDKKLL